jgi:hypothetical protein
LIRNFTDRRDRAVIGLPNHPIHLKLMVDGEPSGAFSASVLQDPGVWLKSQIIQPREKEHAEEELESDFVNI